MAENGREDSHGDQSAKGRGENKQTRVSHGHESGHKECLVTNLRDNDHGKGKDKRVKPITVLEGGIVGSVGR